MGVAVGIAAVGSGSGSDGVVDVGAGSVATASGSGVVGIVSVVVEIDCCDSDVGVATTIISRVTSTTRVTSMTWLTSVVSACTVDGLQPTMLSAIATANGHHHTFGVARTMSGLRRIG